MKNLVAVIVAAAWVAPGVASAQEPVASAVLYEVNEALRFLKPKSRDVAGSRADFARRLARASLLGKEEWAPNKPDGFGCYGCHQHEGAAAKPAEAPAAVKTASAAPAAPTKPASPPAAPAVSSSAQPHRALMTHNPTRQVSTAVRMVLP